MVFDNNFIFYSCLGSIGASVLIGGTCYALTVASGYIYLKIMTEILSQEGKEGFQNLTEADLKRRAEKAAKSSDVENIMKEAKKSYKS